jgi:hypothetical protein
MTATRRAAAVVVGFRPSFEGCFFGPVEFVAAGNWPSGGLDARVLAG